MRGHVEAQISLVAAGKADKAAVVLHTLAQFAHKFRFFVSHIARMDALFEASFSPLASSGMHAALDATWVVHLGESARLFAWNKICQVALCKLETTLVHGSMVLCPSR